MVEYCPKCGKKLDEEVIECPNCGAILEENVKSIKRRRIAKICVAAVVVILLIIIFCSCV